MHDLLGQVANNGYFSSQGGLVVNFVDKQWSISQIRAVVVNFVK
jgi:hypothetical protein